MDREVLEHWLAEGLSLEAMGARADRHPSTISYWLERHGLRAVGRERHCARGALDRELLEALIDEGCTTREIAARVDRSLGTVRHWLRRYALSTKRSQPKRSAGRPQTAQPGDRFRESCPRHGETDFILRADGYARCLRCRSAAVSERRRRVKAQLVSEAGGECVLCGYDRHPAALHFHHIEPGDKSFALASTGSTRSLASAREEARKCVLLCGNCHAEVESGATQLPASILDRSPASPG